MSALLRSAVPSRSVSQLGLRTSVTSLTRKWWLPPPSPSRSGLSCGSVWKSLSTTPSQCLPRDESSKGPTNHSTTPTSAAAKDSTSGPSQADKPPATSEKSEKLLNLPNILTASRILSVPFLGHLILTDRLPAALGLLFVAGCTDLLDGYLARKWQAYTVFGSIADPAADKLLMTVMVATLGWKGLLPGTCSEAQEEEEEQQRQQQQHVGTLTLYTSATDPSFPLHLLHRLLGILDSDPRRRPRPFGLQDPLHHLTCALYLVSVLESTPPFGTSATHPDLKVQHLPAALERRWRSARASAAAHGLQLGGLIPVHALARRLVGHSSNDAVLWVGILCPGGRVPERQ